MEGLLSAVYAGRKNVLRAANTYCTNCIHFRIIFVSFSFHFRFIFVSFSFHFRNYICFLLIVALIGCAKSLLRSVILANQLRIISAS